MSNRMRAIGTFRATVGGAQIDLCNAGETILLAIGSHIIVADRS